MEKVASCPQLANLIIELMFEEDVICHLRNFFRK